VAILVMNISTCEQTPTKAGDGFYFPAITGGLFMVAMTDEVRVENPEKMIPRLPRGSMLIFRHYTHPEREKLAKNVVHECHKRGILCLIAGDIQIARSSGADGVHFPEHQLKNPQHRRFLPPHWIKTAAAHGIRSVRLAENFEVDAILLSPVFATKSHPKARPLGISRFARICTTAKVPVFALGGITKSRINRVRIAGASGVAGIGLFSNK
jgi:thiamine-phosphate pyrophosphorylase